MYNRYIPQPDGSFRRNRVQEPRQPEPPQRRNTPHAAQQAPQVSSPSPAPQKPCDPPKKDTQAVHKPSPSLQESSIGSFLKQLLPKNLDTGDLLIILLLLLMAGDCAEDQNTAMLTLAMYLFM